MGMRIAEAASGAPALAADRIPIQREGDDTPYHLSARDVVALSWPIGSVFLSVVSTDPATLLGFGTWSQIAGGKFLVGQSGADTDFDTAEETGGSKTSNALLAHTHGVTDPGHNHTQTAHTHIQDAHTHIQDAHNHTQTAHTHTIPVGATDDTAAPFDRADAGTNASGANATTASGSTTATNQAATATNQNTTATNQSATAVNQGATTGITATDSAGSGTSFSILPPYLVVFVWKRVS